MPRVIINEKNPNIKMGAYLFPDRKKPCICKSEGNQITVYGTFNSIESADHFMTELAKLIEAKEEDDGKTN